MPRLRSEFSKNLRHVYRKFVRRFVLAGVKTSGAVVAKIRQVVEGCIFEGTVVCHFLEHSTKPFAITTSVTDFEGSASFGANFGNDDGVAQIVSPAAALIPAMRPKTPPMVMPVPAQYPLPKMLPAMISPAA